MKIALIGGGSYAWTPVLIKGFMSNSFFNRDIRICLMDINKEHLDDIYTYSELIKPYYPDSRIEFETTMDLDFALKGSSYVVVSISHGDLEAELEDHRITRKYGLYNVKGSEVGPAGCSRTLRHVPEILRIARRMEKHCPDAIMLNVTNPLTAVTRSVNKYTGIKCVGFCHNVVNHLKPLIPLFGGDFEKDEWAGVEFNVAGVDHCSWFLDLKYYGKDALQIIKDGGWIEKARMGVEISGFDDPFAGRENQRVRFLLWDILGYMPSSSDEHICEFFGQVVKDAETRKYYGMDYDRIIERSRTVENDKLNVKEMISGKRELTGGRVSEQIDDFIAALCGGKKYTDVLNYPNEGQIPNLPMDSVVETLCTVDSTGVHPHTVSLPPILESIVRPITIREELYMEAAAENNFEKLRSALSTDPEVNDFRIVDDLSREIMEYNKRFLINDYIS